ncbi:MAG: sensor histidine kinase [Desulfomonilaceae bacterium]
MKNQNAEFGIVFLCDLDGKVMEVIRDEIGLSETICCGRSLSTIVDRGSFGKTLNFIVEIKSRGAVFDWQLGIPVLDRVEILNFAGVLWDKKLFIVAAKTTDGLEKLVDELSLMGNEQINILRSLMKDRTDLIQKHSQREIAFYEELAKLNNELANLQRELAKKNVELEKLNEEKNKFLGMAAHDLRNPLNAIQMYSEFLLEEATEVLNPEQLEFVSIIHSSSGFMLQLVNDLLDVAKIESGKLELELEPTDLGRLVQKNASLNKVMATKKQIEFNLHLDDKIPPVLVDSAKIEQVLNNLITNAVKFSNPGGVIDIWVSKSEGEVIVSVKDNGQGIPREELSKLFKPFQRTSVKSTAGEESTGLGLAIVRKIVTGHKGRVWVESEVSKGSTFFVALPQSSD